EASPLGYDVAEMVEGGDFVLYAESFTQAYARAEEIPFGQLLFRLQLQATAGPPDLSGAEFLYLATRRGLGPALLRFLCRSRVPCEACFCEPPPGSAFEAREARWMVRVAALPDRMLRLFVATPGFGVYRPVAANVALEIGYRHPIHLDSCLQVFAPG